MSPLRRFLRMLGILRIRCAHDWRPLLGRHQKVGRVCPKCNTREEMTEKDFHAQFGDGPYWYWGFF